MSILAIVEAFRDLPDIVVDQVVALVDSIRRVLLGLDYKAYSICLTRFFEIEPLCGETIALDGKVLRGSYSIDTPASITVVSSFDSNGYGLCSGAGTGFIYSTRGQQE